MNSPSKILPFSSAQAVSAGLVHVNKAKKEWQSTQLWSLHRLLISQKVSDDPDGALFLLGYKSRSHCNNVHFGTLSCAFLRCTKFLWIL